MSETITLVPHKAGLAGDPRAAMSGSELVLAGQNRFPVVANRVGRRDGLGLAAGAGAALLLGGVTFWSMSGDRDRAAAPPAPSHASATAFPRPAAVSRPPAAGADVVAVPPALPASANPSDAGPQAGTAPVLVMDAAGGDPAPVQVAAAASPAAPGAPRQTIQQPLSENEAFGARIGDAQVEVASATRMANPSTTVSQGTLIPAVLETAVDSDLPGYVRALVSRDVKSFDGSRVLIPRSSRLIGQYKSGLAAGQRRAYILWSRLIRPDGVSVAIASPAIDYAGRTGLTGEVDGHFMQRFGSAMLLSVVGGVAAIGSGGASLILSGGQSAASVAAQRDAQIPPTIRIRPGQPIRVFTARDLDFTGAD